MPNRRQFLQLAGIGTAASLTAGVGMVRALPPADNSSPAPSRELEPFSLPPDLFPILPWDTLHGWSGQGRNLKNGLESIAECNFTLAGFVKPEDLPLCEKLGLAAIMAPVLGKELWLKLSGEEIKNRVERVIEQTGHSKAVLGYFLVDEPGVLYFPGLAKGVAAVKKYAPGKLAYINLFPSYATVGAPDSSQLGTATFTEYVERFVAEVKPQLLSYDNYMVEFSDDLQDEKLASVYFADLLEIRRIAQKNGLPFWNIVSCNQLRPETTVPSPANLALQAYTTLAAGGRGVSWYKYFADGYAYAPIDAAGEKTDTWRYLQVVNRQLRTLGPIVNRLRSTGVFVTAPAPFKHLPVLPGRVVEQVHSTASIRGRVDVHPPVMVGEFSDERGNDYLMLVNLSLQRSANVKLKTVKPKAVKQVFSAEDGRLLPWDEEQGQWLTAGQGVLVKVAGK